MCALQEARVVINWLTLMHVAPQNDAAPNSAADAYPDDKPNALSLPSMLSRIALIRKGWSNERHALAR